MIALREKWRTITTIIGTALAIATIIISIGVWKGTVSTKLDSQDKRISTLEKGLTKLKETNEESFEAIDHQNTEIQIKLQELSTGQDWIIMKLKGELE